MNSRCNKNASLPIALDLDGVTLVDVEVVRYLKVCAANNVELLHCSPTSPMDAP